MTDKPDVRKRRFDWREDLSKARDLSKREIDAYGYVLGWMEDWRQKQGMEAGRDAARQWWKEVANITGQVTHFNKADLRPALATSPRGHSKHRSR